MRGLYCGALALLLTGTAAAQDRPTAVFEVELLDTSGEGTKPDEAARIQATTAELRRLVEGAAAYRVIDLAPAAEIIEARRPVRNCNGCELDIARDLGAEVSFTTVVHKVSTLILSMQIVARDVKTGEPLAMGVSDFRGDNNEAWLHSIRWLAKNRLGLVAAK
ncbi:DUF3280 domain-containing protein [Aerophototrophica crusticola]|uniref:DUF3280 domain-containing protein n=1 Tax=Aerophototrophica crusticola TaxID=1709002 RepID=A0A858R454_9PROT|nr:DUF3280 domain-containing protein [Rhodospirillaceae bacterium B3]